MFDVSPRHIISGVLLMAVTVVLSACATGERHYATSVVDYLYPDDEPVVTPSIPVLKLPLRVGIAFVPGRTTSGRLARPMVVGQGTAFGLTESRKQALMQEVVAHFKRYEFVKSIEVIPSAYLSAKGGFANLDQLRTLYGIDVIALLSYDQVQFTDEGVLSLTYWTLVGAYIVPASKNATHTMLDAVVYDITSRKMLFRAPGISNIEGRAAYANLSEELRSDSQKGFDEAAKQMVVNLDEQLQLFREKVKASPEEYKVVRRPGYTGGGGALDPLVLAVLAGFGVSRFRSSLH